MFSIKDTEFADVKQVLTQTIPGMFALAPFFYFEYLHSIHFSFFCNNHTQLLASVFIVASILMGAILNELGTYIEARFDSILLTENEWGKYLLGVPTNSIIHKVISTVVLRLKFNLNMSISVLFFQVGANICLINNETKVYSIFINLACTILIIFFIQTAFYMAKGLHSYREIINNARG